MKNTERGYSRITKEGLEAMLDCLIHHARKSDKKTTTRVKKIVIKTVFDERKRLDRFFKRVVDMTEHHHACKDDAVVFASDLGKALSVVDPNWAYKSLRLKG
jgi:hypothetical protein